MHLKLLCFIANIAGLAAKLFILGGQPDSANRKAEIVDLNVPNVTCPDVADYPAALYGTVGVHINNVAMVCGGYNGSHVYVPDCFVYEREGDLWLRTEPMIETRYAAASVQLSPSTWWVTGGYSGQGPLRSTELFTVGQGFSTFVDLPAQKYWHNLVKVNSTHVMLLGGQPAFTTTWMFNLETETWIDMPDLLIASGYLQAGLVITAQGCQIKKIVTTN